MLQEEQEVLDTAPEPLKAFFYFQDIFFVSQFCWQRPGRLRWMLLFRIIKGISIRG
jgi:hypothetical protein